MPDLIDVSKRQRKKGDKNMTNDDIQVTEIQETDPIAAIQIESDAVEAIAAVADIEDVADPSEEAGVDDEVVAEAEAED
jgi:hypothetical protein